MKHSLNYEDLIIVMIVKLGLKGDSCSELDFFFSTSSLVFLISSIFSQKPFSYESNLITVAYLFSQNYLILGR